MRKGVLFLLFLIGILFVSIIYAAVSDSDQDGVPDANDRCPDSDTTVVDQFGCSCSQKDCPNDNNPCTDDCSIIDGLPTCGAFNNNNNQCPGGYCSNGKCETQFIKEQVKCVFEDSTDTQECYNSKGDKCTDVETCVVDIKGKKGEKITWKSSCGGYAYTIIDGQNEHAIFYCGAHSGEEIKEQVKCVFQGSRNTETCYSAKGNCLGLGFCEVGVKGKKGEEVIWKSSCGKYASTIIDGNDEKVVFECSSDYVEDIKEQVKCVFEGSTSTQECYSEKESCKGIETCVVDVKGKKGEKITWKSSCGGYAYTIIDGQNEHAIFDCKSISGNPPLPPFDLRVSTATDFEGKLIAKLEWENVNGEAFYIYKNKNDGDFIFLAKTKDKFYKDTEGLSKDVKYGYYVTALNGYGESKPSNTVHVYPIKLKSCAEQGGDACAGAEVCPENSIKASDTERCCSAQCRTRSQQSCSQCGKGLFNLCDRTECNSIAELCYFIPSRKCNRCAGASCESYTNQQTCSENHCNFANCAWKENNCITANSTI